MRERVATVVVALLACVSSSLAEVRYSVTDLGTLGGTNSNASGINASGQIAGESQITGNSWHPVVWTGSIPTDLGPLDGTRSDAIGINDSGQVAGQHNPATGGYRAVRWTGTTATDLGTLGGTNSRGLGINVAGQVTGESQITGNGANHAVRWTGTTATDLGTLGGTNSYAYGINASGDVIGLSYLSNNSSENAFLYTGGTMYDLITTLSPGSGITSLSVNVGHGINDAGQIAATGIINGQYHALRLDPVPTPEPSSALLMLGSGAFLVMRKRRTSF